MRKINNFRKHQFNVHDFHSCIFFNRLSMKKIVNMRHSLSYVESP